MRKCAILGILTRTEKMENRSANDSKVGDFVVISSDEEMKNYFKSIDSTTKNIHSMRVSAVFHLLNEAS